MPKSTKTKALAMPIRKGQHNQIQPPLPAVNKKPSSNAKAKIAAQVPAIANQQRPRAKKRTQAQMQEEDQKFILPAGEKRQRRPSGTYAQMNTGGALDIKEEGEDEAEDMGRNKRRRTSSEEGHGTKIAREKEKEFLEFKLLPLPDGLRTSLENSRYISTPRWSMLLETAASNSLLALASSSSSRSNSSASDECMHDQDVHMAENWNSSPSGKMEGNSSSCNLSSACENNTLAGSPSGAGYDSDASAQTSIEADAAMLMELSAPPVLYPGEEPYKRSPKKGSRPRLAPGEAPYINWTGIYVNAW